MVHPYYQIQLSHIHEQTVVMHSDSDNSQRLNEGGMSVLNDYLLNDSTYMLFLKTQNYSDGKLISDCPWKGMKRGCDYRVTDGLSWGDTPVSYPDNGGNVS